MAALLRVQVLDPQNILDTYGAGAKVYIHRGLTDDVDDASAVGSGVAVVAGTTEYEYADAAGTPGVDRYFVRFGKATVSSADDAGGWSPPMLAGNPGGEVLTLETAKLWSGVGDTDDDGWLVIAVGSINRCIIRDLGVDIGPSPDTTRTYDACKAVQNGRRLWIVGGIRSFTTVEVSHDGSTWTAITSDVRIGPLVHERGAGEPGAYIEFKPYTSSYSSFAGYAYVRITGETGQTFGWDAYPFDLVQGAGSALQRMSKERGGRGEFPNEAVAEVYLRHMAGTIRAYRTLYFPGVA